MSPLPLHQVILAFLGLAWTVCSVLVLVLIGWDLLRCRRAPLPSDTLLVIGGPLSLALAARLALKDSR